MEADPASFQEEWVLLTVGSAVRVQENASSTLKYSGSGGSCLDGIYHLMLFSKTSRN